MKLHRYILVFFDAFLVVLCFFLALFLRFEGDIPTENMNNYLTLIPMIAGISGVTFVAIDLYNRLWEYASVKELVAIVKAVSISVAILIISVYFLNLGKL
ncbi:MAG: polysaccharide biosynthesis protein, partial [Syntrophomonadaceae bacterium]|nr:polysaccharide biosynthesis protein [Syntrophomonadaceae bacterium]